jgi:tRNA(Arg) A34 adenosine deaminase TadA
MQTLPLAVAGAERDDREFMQAALRLAVAGACAGEVPVGALLVRGGDIVAGAHNAPISREDPTAHAEILALRAAGRATGSYRLPDTTLYVTVEPCLMCVGALLHARVTRVVYGCTEPKWGALGSVFTLSASTNHRFDVCGGVCAAEAAALLRSFFQMRRGA